MKKIKIIGQWEKTFLVDETQDALKKADEIIAMYPHLKMKKTGIQHVD
jgi:hypothetical protein